MAEQLQICIICDKAVANNRGRKVQKQGLQTLTDYSIKFRDKKHSKCEILESAMVHTKCRMEYINRKEEENCDEESTISPPKAKLRTLSGFDFENLCFFCSELCSVKAEKKRRGNKARRICTITKAQGDKTVRDKANSSQSDEAREVRRRISNIPSLMEIGAKYHSSCRAKFLALTDSDRTKSAGRPASDNVQRAFQQVYDHINSIGPEQIDLKEIKTILGDVSLSNKYIKERLSEHYGNEIIFSTFAQKTIITFRKSISKIINDNWYTARKASPEEERLRIVESAAKIIYEDIRCMAFNDQHYLAADKFLNNVGNETHMPKSLEQFLNRIIMQDKKGDRTKPEIKKIAIGHAIISAVKPKSFLSPLLLAFSIYLHRKYASKSLLDVTSRLGFSVSYNATVNYEAASVMQKPSWEIPTYGGFVQFVFDNADFNNRTLDGKNTFHFMGGVECNTPASSVPKPEPIERLTRKPSPDTIVQEATIKLLHYEHQEKSPMKKIKIEDIVTLLNISDNALDDAGPELIYLLSTVINKDPLSGMSLWKSILPTNTSMYRK